MALPHRPARRQRVLTAAGVGAVQIDQTAGFLRARAGVLDVVAGPAATDVARFDHCSPSESSTGGVHASQSQT